MSRTRKVSLLIAVAAVGALTFGGMKASASPNAGETTEDHLVPAGTHVTGTSSRTVFSVGHGVIIVTCTHSTSGTTTAKTGLPFTKISPLPQFNDGAGKPCTDNTGSTDTTTTQGTWLIGFLDKASDETSAEPNAGDRLEVIVPKAGAIVTNTLHCKIIVAPNGPFKVIGAYDDHSKFTVNISGLPIQVSGPAQCPSAATTSTFTGVYIFSPGVHDVS